MIRKRIKVPDEADQKWKQQDTPAFFHSFHEELGTESFHQACTLLLKNPAMTGKTWLFTAVWVSLVKERTPVRPPGATCIPCAEPAPSVLGHILQTGTQGSLGLHSTRLYRPACQTGQGLRCCPLPVLCFIYMSTAGEAARARKRHSTDTHRPAARVSILQCPTPDPNSRAQ